MYACAQIKKNLTTFYLNELWRFVKFVNINGSLTLLGLQYLASVLLVQEHDMHAHSMTAKYRSTNKVVIIIINNIGY